jgi:hypothetical protein
LQLQWRRISAPFGPATIANKGAHPAHPGQPQRHPLLRIRNKSVNPRIRDQNHSMDYLFPSLFVSTVPWVSFSPNNQSRAQFPTP